VIVLYIVYGRNNNFERSEAMLDRQDLEMIRLVMKEEITASEMRMENRMDARFEEQEKRIDARFEEQEKRNDARFAEQDECFGKRMEMRFAQEREWLEKHLDKRFAASENLILGELDRIHIKLQDQLDDMKQRLDEMTEYYRIKKLDDINGALLLQMIQEVERRVEALEKKSA
jgi:DNA anti-recombination protein RmuC